MKKIATKISQSWYNPPRWFTYLLFPLSILFRFIVFIRKTCYQIGLLTSYQSPVPVIVVGNISVGGTGKTPLVIYLADLLKKQGYRPGIVSRGYGGENKQAVFIDMNSDPLIAGDEPVLIAKRTNCPLVICRDRCQAIRKLINESNCDIIISDDGLQHYRFKRDIEIVVIDGKRRFGNKLCLPAGPLREPPSRIRSASMIVVNGRGQPGEYSMVYQTGQIINLANQNQRMPVSSWQNKIVHAVAGIGHPDNFFNTLKTAGIKVISHSYPDHYVYKPSDIHFGDGIQTIMTEKDAVKCNVFVDNNCWYLPITASLTTEFNSAILKLVTGIRDNDKDH